MEHLPEERRGRQRRGQGGGGLEGQPGPGQVGAQGDGQDQREEEGRRGVDQVRQELQGAPVQGVAGAHPEPGVEVGPAQGERQPHDPDAKTAAQGRGQVADVEPLLVVAQGLAARELDPGPQEPQGPALAQVPLHLCLEGDHLGALGVVADRHGKAHHQGLHQERDDGDDRQVAQEPEPHGFTGRLQVSRVKSMKLNGSMVSSRSQGRVRK